MPRLPKVTRVRVLLLRSTEDIQKPAELQVSRGKYLWTKTGTIGNVLAEEVEPDSIWFYSFERRPIKLTKALVSDDFIDLAQVELRARAEIYQLMLLEDLSKEPFQIARRYPGLKPKG